MNRNPEVITDAARAEAAVMLATVRARAKQDEYVRSARITMRKIHAERRLANMTERERVTASERGWEPGDGWTVALIIVVIFVAGALAGAIAP